MKNDLPQLQCKLESILSENRHRLPVYDQQQLEEVIQTLSKIARDSSKLDDFGKAFWLILKFFEILDRF